MSVEEIQEILTLVGSFGTGAVIAGLIVFFILKSFLPSYLSEKGKNLATKEDVGKITDEIEKIRMQYATQLQDTIHQNNLLLEGMKVRHQLRIAALDRRLQAHQEAFELWRKLISNVHNNDIGNVVIECQDWWDKNCLYLSPKAREAFNYAYHCAHIHRSFLHDRTSLDLVKKNWKNFCRFLLLIRCVGVSRLSGMPVVKNMITFL
ncbi:MAG: hypothetical protein MRJ65_17760 [Candidatus Brocadiaceae bacterium]|nr:hypothetical protein [Candidatus Brocadiaceae bacterium]